MAPTSEEDIAKQHNEAIRLVESELECMTLEPTGEIPLSDKVKPIQDLFMEKQNSFVSQNQHQQKQEKECNNTNDNGNEQHHDEEKKEEQQQPTKSIDEYLNNPMCFSTRGYVDVSKIQQLIEDGYNDTFPQPVVGKGKEGAKNSNGKTNNNNNTGDKTTTTKKMNYWDPQNAAKCNVSITRPSHDAWGIKKIVLLFCDDLLHRTYELPWYKDFHHVLQPILSLLPKNHILVRLLFASLPQGVTIPIHHDTGEWVKSTHRVHVPIIVTDPKKVLFRCGPTSTTMSRIDCTPGHVFEINNQAKHAVSNCGNDCRVHLILDYIDGTTTSPLVSSLSSRIVLKSGERLIQTRRSIDRYIDVKENQRPTPTYIILGAQKAGTTSLYEYMVQHPWIIRARRRETHCLDWRWNDMLKTTKQQLEYCHKFFYTDDLKHVPSCLTGDSTPSYLLDSVRVIPRIKKIYTHWKEMKFFIMIRDPIKRAESHYAMVTSPIGTEAQLKTRGMEWRTKTINEVIDDEFNKMNECGLIPYWDNKTKTVNNDIFMKFHNSIDEDKAWERYVTKYVPLNTGSYGLLTRGLYTLQLRTWFNAFHRDQFLILQLEQFKNDGINTIMKKVWSHLDLPTFTLQDTEAKNTREYKSLMDIELQSTLQRFFQPHNRSLAKLLGEEWKDVWEY